MYQDPKDWWWLEEGFASEKVKKTRKKRKGKNDRKGEEGETRRTFSLHQAMRVFPWTPSLIQRCSQRNCKSHYSLWGVHLLRLEKPICQWNVPWAILSPSPVTWFLLILDDHGHHDIDVYSFRVNEVGRNSWSCQVELVKGVVVHRSTGNKQRDFSVATISTDI